MQQPQQEGGRRPSGQGRNRMERAPWCGGYWERLVRSIKVALSKVLGRCHAKPDDLRTVLCEIEARINDRPLTIVSDRPDDQLALTPAHFLIGREL
ncbi:hypothetical protein T07_8598 [Trichinella nelsoni]|uniref:Integrase catalytic domain-containing protein n=1 Tax=Trichinella nelsoni TaxID=6336 RepID=A0A0V0S157_9BILA|nr:hypothetical protein T07_8598 [Trichinella nelsoni]